MSIAAIEKLDEAIAEILEEYGDAVFRATEEGLTKAEKILIKNLKSKSPKSEGGGEYARSWRSKGKKHKLKRFVGNTKTVKGKTGDIPLSNILEYSIKSPHQGLIRKTTEDSMSEMARAIIDEVKKG